MKETIQEKVLKSIDVIYRNAKGCKLSDEYFYDVNDELELVADYLDITKMQAFLYAVIFTMNYRGSMVSIPDMIRYFYCSPIDLVRLSNDFDKLVEKEYLLVNVNSHTNTLKRISYKYVINEKITESIIKNKPLPELTQYVFNDINELLEQVNVFAHQREDGSMHIMHLGSHIRSILDNNRKFPLIEYIRNLELSIEDAFILLILTWKVLNGTGSMDIDRLSEIVYDYVNNKIELLNSMMNKNHILTKLNLVETGNGMFGDDITLKLTDNAIKIFRKKGLMLFRKENKRSDVVRPKDIHYKELYYNPGEMRQIAELKSILEPKRFRQIQQRLKKKGHNTGVAILMYGAPGTGKTETVYQLAKASGREIMYVDISNSKSMWFGQSEKIVKRIFSDYSMYLQESRRTPILLFNEADAILSKRKDSTSSNVAQTENAIQNIILQELENFNGLFMATTNLVDNLDPAFERRFLFKVEFFAPDSNILPKIWRSLLKGYTESEYRRLAGSYDFTGGQIANVAKKADIYEIVNGKRPPIGIITEYCNAEKIYKESMRRIGFVA
jgi:ATP-dependent 26S proteasome regulatory subunit